MPLTMTDSSTSIIATIIGSKTKKHRGKVDFMGSATISYPDKNQSGVYWA